MRGLIKKASVLVSDAVGDAVAVGRAYKRAIGGLVTRLCIAAALFGSALVGDLWATEPTPLLPDTGIDFETMVVEVVSKIGVVVGLVVAAYFAFLVVRRLMSWGRRIG